MDDCEPDTPQTQQTQPQKGEPLTIPVPSRDEFLRNIAKVAPKAAREKESARIENCPDCGGEGFSTKPGGQSDDEREKCDGKGWVPAK